MTPRIVSQSSGKGTTKKQKDSGSENREVDLVGIALAIKDNPRWFEATKALSGLARAHGHTSAFNHRRALHQKPNHTHWTYDDLMAYYMMLQEHGAGHLVVRPNAEPVFVWRVYSIDVTVPAVRWSRRSVSEIKNMPTPKFKPANLREKRRRFLPPEAPTAPAQVAPAASPAVHRTQVQTPVIQVGSTGDLVLVHIRGMEFELNLSKVPPELLKFKRML